MSFMQALGEFTRTELQQVIQEQSRKTEDLMKVQDKYCYETAGDDVDKFVECTINKHESISKVQKTFEYQMEFLQFRLLTCFEAQSQTNQDYSSCKKQGVSDMQNYFETFQKQL